MVNGVLVLSRFSILSQRSMLRFPDNAFWRPPPIKCSALKCNIYRGNHVNLSWFSCGPSSLVQMEFVAMIFVGGKTEEPRGKPSEQGDNLNQQQTKPTCDAGQFQTRSKLWEVSTLRSPLCHP